MEAASIGTLPMGGKVAGDPVVMDLGVVEMVSA
jgi:hypothetical protein